jgi:hypothetical protein
MEARAGDYAPVDLCLLRSIYSAGQAALLLPLIALALLMLAAPVRASVGSNTYGFGVFQKQVRGGTVFTVFEDVCPAVRSADSVLSDVNQRFHESCFADSGISAGSVPDAPVYEERRRSLFEHPPINYESGSYATDIPVISVFIREQNCSFNPIPVLYGIAISLLGGSKIFCCPCWVGSDANKNVERWNVPDVLYEEFHVHTAVFSNVEELVGNTWLNFQPRTLAAYGLAQLTLHDLKLAPENNSGGTGGYDSEDGGDGSNRCKYIEPASIRKLPLPYVSFVGVMGFLFGMYVSDNGLKAANFARHIGGWLFAVFSGVFGLGAAILFGVGFIPCP